MTQGYMSILSAIALGTVAGCASVPMASADLDAAAKTFSVTPGMANVYVYRNEFFGSAYKVEVVLDGTPVGSTAINSYLLLAVPPGRHELLSRGANSSVIELQVQAGQNYFVWQEVKMGGFSVGSKLHLVDEAKAKVDMKDCRLIQTH